MSTETQAPDDDESDEHEPANALPERERPAALLNSSQREYLKGEKDYTQQGESSARARIRDRIRASMYDLALLSETYPYDEIRRVFGVDGDDEHEPARAWPLAAFLYATRTNSVTPEFVDEDPASHETLKRRADSVAREVERGVMHGLASREQLAPTSVKCSLELAPNPIQLPASVEALAEIEREQLDNLYATGEIDREKYADAMARRLGRDDDHDGAGAEAPADD